jgi:hypothetical protein
MYVADLLERPDDFEGTNYSKCGGAPEAHLLTIERLPKGRLSSSMWVILMSRTK